MGRLLRALSLDVVAGALCGGLLAEDVAGVRMRAEWWVALAAAVWCVYTGDHLLDALRARGPLVADRHLFHQRHARFLGFALGVGLLVGLLASLGLRTPVRDAGLGLTGLVALYLLSAQRLLLPRLPKEPFAAALYAAGIWVGPLIVSGLRVEAVAAALLQGFAALLNLCALGCFEVAIDERLGARSLARQFGSDRVRSATRSASVIATLFAFSAALRWPFDSTAFAVIGLQVALPGVMLSLTAWFQRGERYRSVGDAVFLLGALPRLLR